MFQWTQLQFHNCFGKSVSVSGILPFLFYPFIFFYQADIFEGAKFQEI